MKKKKCHQDWLKLAKRKEFEVILIGFDKLTSNKNHRQPMAVCEEL